MSDSAEILNAVALLCLINTEYIYTYTCVCIYLYIMYLNLVVFSSNTVFKS